jgi:hypothetical protein
MADLMCLAVIMVLRGVPRNALLCSYFFIFVKMAISTMRSNTLSYVFSEIYKEISHTTEKPRE